ncbi:DUF2939 domain-containing protein [Psychrobacter sp. FDAARGOS_221]|uniref:DUF2939 domain-containing protein n=1 Tax=Psychrobacter sp. FDAARGOS_221 TaxID=1975705 RepID=UPI000BB5530A|nr:DUF2939 domain-containing protein [Psychrobacter sp. FDAARGOS_221]PNK59996.1 DUF2939 domain-containing protein [Psychrobacter sp. FDAARGOS_221]
MKKPFIWIAAIVVIIAAYLYASPYLALRSIKNAALEGNADVLSEHIDFPSVKQSLKDQINAQLMKEVAKEDADGFEALGAMLATAMIDPIVDSIVTPEGIAMMVQGKEPLQQDDAEDESKDATEAMEAELNPNIDYKTGYVSYKTFKVTLSNKDHDGEPMDIIMRRDGLGWKVTRIALPADTFDNNGSEIDDAADLALEEMFDFGEDESLSLN